MRYFLILFVVTILTGCSGHLVCEYESRSEMIEDIARELEELNKE